MKKRDKIKSRSVAVTEGFWPTSDDWCPNFPRNTVEYRVHVYHNPDKVGHFPDGLIRIVFRGADDRIMAKDIKLPVSEYESKLKEIKNWLEYRLPNPITQDWLKTQGFQYE